MMLTKVDEMLPCKYVVPAISEWPVNGAIENSQKIQRYTLYPKLC